MIRRYAVDDPSGRRCAVKIVWMTNSVVSCVAVGLLVAPVYAQQKNSLEQLSEGEKEAFETFMQAGKEAFEAGRYDKALRALNEAYFVYPLPGLLFRIGQCHENLGHMSQASESYQKYLDSVPEAKNRKEVEAKIAALEQMKEAKLTIRTEPEGARVLINGQFEGRSPHTVKIASDEVEVRIEASGHEPIMQTITLEAGVQKELFFALQPDVVEESAVATTPEGMSARKKGGVVLMAAGGAALIGGGVFTGIGAQSRGALNSLDRTAPRPVDYNARYERANFRSNLGLGLLGVGVLSACVGSWLFFSDTSEGEPSATSLEFLPVLSPSGQGFAMSLSF